MDEQMVMIQRLGRVQARMTQTVQQMVAKINQQEAEIIRLRAGLIVSRTCMLWGLQGLAHTDPIRPPGGARRLAARGVGERGAASRSITDPVICQTGCISHAHHWLDESGLCARDGEPCDQRVESGGRCVSAA